MRKWQVWMVLAVAMVAVRLAAGTVYYQQGVYSMGIDRETPSNSTILYGTSSSTPVLAFAGLTLQQIIDDNYAMYGIFCGASVGTNYRGQPIGVYNLQSYTNDAGMVSEVFCMANIIESPFTKSVMFMLYDGADGVYARWWTTRYIQQENLYLKFATLTGYDTLTYVNGNNNYNGTATGYSSGKPGICGLTASRFIPATEPILVWKSDGEQPTLTLNDIKDYEFAGYFSGASVDKKGYPVKAYNKTVETDGSGSITGIRAEFQLADDRYVKCVVVRFTNGADGVYAQALDARYLSLEYDNGGLGSKFVNDDGSYAYRNGGSVATSFGVANYGVFELYAYPDDFVELVLDESKTFQQLTSGVDLGDRSKKIRIRVTGENPTLTLDCGIDRSSIEFVNESVAGTAAVTFPEGTAYSFTLDQLTLGEGLTLSLPIDIQPAEIAVDLGSAVSYSGDGTLVPTITGGGGLVITAGNITVSNQQSSYSGGTLVKSGASVQPGNSCTVIGSYLRYGPFGSALQTNKIKIEAGAKYDLAGVKDVNYYYDIIGDDPIVNTGAEVDNGKSQMRGITLSGDASISQKDNGFHLISPGYSLSGVIELGAYTLTKKGEGTFCIWTGGTTVSGSGTLEVEEGAISVNKGSLTGNDATLKIDATGTVEVSNNLTFSAIENNGAINFNPGSATNTISGTYSGTGVVRKTGKNLGLISFHNGAKSVYYVDQGTLGIYNRVSVSGNPYAFNTPENPNANMSVVVADGATFDLNGVADTSCSVTLAGTGVGGKGAFVNNKSHVSADNLQTVQLTLADDALVGGAYDFGLLAPGHRDTLLELGAYKLTINKTGNFWLHNATVTGTGTILVENGTLRVDKTKSLAEEATVEIGENGTLQLNIDMTMGNLVDNGAITGAGVPIVKGTVTATATEIPKLTLLDGATIKIPDADTPLKVSGAYTASGTIHVDAEGVEMGDKAYVELTSFPAAANCTYKLDKAAPGLCLAVVDGNLRLARGGLLILLM